MKRFNFLVFSIFTVATLVLLSGLSSEAAWNKQADGSWTYSDSEGKLLKSAWLKDGKHYYNFDANGYMRKNSWFLENGKYYCFDESGSMYTGTAIIDNKLTVFDENGAFRKTITHIDGLEDDVLATAIEQSSRYRESSKYALKAVNAMRREKGLPDMELSLALSIIANYRNAEMHKYNYFAHDKDGETRPYIVGARLFKYPETHGENIYKYKYSVDLDQSLSSYIDSGNTAYKKSPGHYNNIITPEFKHIGLGVSVFDNNSVYYTQIFSRD